VYTPSQARCKGTKCKERAGLTNTRIAADRVIAIGCCFGNGRYSPAGWTCGGRVNQLCSSESGTLCCDKESQHEMLEPCKHAWKASTVRRQICVDSSADANCIAASGMHARRACRACSP
jgi:hypothetical protein